MIFIAKGMNAADNNLGQLKIKSVEDISQETINLLNIYGGTYSDDQKIAVDDFLTAFNTASWKDNVKSLTMPFLGVPSEQDESFLWYENEDEPVFMYDLVAGHVTNPMCQASNGAKYRLKNGGLVITSENNTAIPVRFGTNKVNDLSKAGVGIFCNKLLDQFGYADVFNHSEDNKVIQLGAWWSSLTVDTEKINSGEMHFINLSDKFSLISGDTVVDSKPAPTGKDYSSISGDRRCQAKLEMNDEFALRSTVITEGMTDEEFIELGKLIKTLITAFGY